MLRPAYCFSDCLEMKSAYIIAAVGLILPSAVRAQSVPAIEVTGSATVYIVPNIISTEIGMEEYYEYKAGGDSALVRISEIERRVRYDLESAGVADSAIVVSDMGNYRGNVRHDGFLMAKRLTFTVGDFSQLEDLADKLDKRGITSFNITKTDNTDISRYNRQGLEAALNAAREKAEFIAVNENLSVTSPLEIVECGPNYYDTPSFSNVALESGAGMESIRRIVRRYSVKVRYGFTPR